MAAYRWVYGFGQLRADWRGPVDQLRNPYARTSMELFLLRQFCKICISADDFAVSILLRFIGPTHFLRIRLLCLKRCFFSDVCLTSVAYIGPKSRTERPRKTKIGTEVANVTRTPVSRSKGQRSTCCCLK